MDPADRRADRGNIDAPSSADGHVRLLAYMDAVVRGGAEQTLGNLLASLDDRYEVTVVGVDRTVVDWVARRRPGTETRLVAPVRNKVDATRFAALLRCFRRLRPDLVHVGLPAPTRARYGLIAGLLTRGASVVAVENSPLASHSRFQIAAKRLTSWRLGAHVAVSSWLARDVENVYGLPAGSIHTIHNGVPTDAPTSVERIATGPVVGTVARLSPEKGVDVLVRAMALVPDATLAVVGSGDERGALERLAGELGIGHRVVFTGWDGEARRRLGGLDLFVLPSRIEALPLSILEAMLAARAVVATDVGGVREVVVDGETGLLVAPDDVPSLASAVATLLSDDERRAEMGRLGRERALAEFTADRMARRYEELYGSLLAARSRPVAAVDRLVSEPDPSR